MLQKVANSLEECIQVTYEIPEMSVNGKLPVLDLEIWVENNEVKHSFYKKPVSSEYTILSRSALSSSTKSNTTFMECYRRIVNCSPNTPWKEVSDHISKYMNCMRISGYTQKERYNTVKGAVERYTE